MGDACGVDADLCAAVVDAGVAEGEEGVLEELAGGEGEGGGVGGVDAKLDGVEEGGVGEECAGVGGDEVGESGGGREWGSVCGWGHARFGVESVGGEGGVGVALVSEEGPEGGVVEVGGGARGELCRDTDLGRVSGWAGDGEGRTIAMGTDMAGRGEGEYATVGEGGKNPRISTRRRARDGIAKFETGENK